MATLTKPETKVFKSKTKFVVSTPELSEEELWEKATAAMQQMALNATALADTAAGLVQKLDAINAQISDGGSRVSR